MGYLQSARQRLGAAAHFVGKHAATAGKIALATAAVAGAAYNAHQSHAAGALRQQIDTRHLAHRDSARLRQEYERDRARVYEDDGNDDWMGYTARRN